jgi:hypothetical protein
MRPQLNGGTLGGRAMHRRYHLNVVGPFYVEDGCCTLCGVPESEAPDLFGSDPTQCFVKKQPVTPAELDLMINALRTQDLGCVRYTGNDARVLETIRAWNDLPNVDASWWQRIVAWFAAGRGN